MTTVISRVYADETTATGVLDALSDAGFPKDTMSMIHGGDSAEADIVAARVSSKEAAGFAEALTGGAVMAVVRAPMTPFGAARAAMSIMDDAPSSAGSNVHIKEQPKYEFFPSVLRDHRRFLSGDMDLKSSGKHKLFSGGFYWPTLTKHRSRHSAMRGGGFMSRMFWPQPLLKDKPRNSVIKGGKHMLPIQFSSLD